MIFSEIIRYEHIPINYHQINMFLVKPNKPYPPSAFGWTLIRTFVKLLFFRFVVYVCEQAVHVYSAGLQIVLLSFTLGVLIRRSQLFLTNVPDV